MRDLPLILYGIAMLLLIAAFFVTFTGAPAGFAIGAAIAGAVITGLGLIFDAWGGE